MSNVVFSVITPTHKPKYLMDAYKSLLAQEDATWEWIIIVNGDAKVDDVHPEIMGDSRNSVYHIDEIDTLPDMDNKDGNIGYLKHAAATLGVSDYILELDHDDMLSPDAMSRMKTVIDLHSPDFIYSDFVEFFESGFTNVYDKTSGWESYKHSFVYWDHTSRKEPTEKYVAGMAMKAFDINPASLSRIEFAPNHVRVWKRSFYNNIGGHNITLPVADDYDLVCRTFVEGGAIAYINAPLYRYRITGENTVSTRNDEIQNAQLHVGNYYRDRIIQEWCKRNRLRMIDLGGAHNSPEGYQSVDYQDADHNCDIAEGLPFPDNSIGCVRAVDFLEHIPKCRNSGCKHEKGECAIAVMKEIYRVLVPNGVLWSNTPSTDGRGAWQDLTHLSGWNDNSFWYFTQDTHRKYYRNMDAKFKALQVYTSAPNKYCVDNKILYVKAILVAVKPEEIVAGTLNEH